MAVHCRPIGAERALLFAGASFVAPEELVLYHFRLALSANPRALKIESTLRTRCLTCGMLPVYSHFGERSLPPVVDLQNGTRRDPSLCQQCSH